MAEQGPRYDTTQFSVRVAGIALAILSAAIVAVGAALWLLWLDFEGDVAGPGESAPRLELERQMAIPRLQVDPGVDLAELRARHLSVLTSAAWVDREAGIARIPIDQAMDILARRGWPEGAP